MDGLTKKQRAVIQDFFTGEMDEAAVLAKHKVSTRRYEKWLADERFIAALDRRMARAHREALVTVARYAPVAGAKLVQLTASEAAETARKACLDVMSMSRPASGPVSGAGSAAGAEAKHPAELSPETAGRLLAALAETQSDRGTKDEG
jgi:hypothetical protein